MPGRLHEGLPPRAAGAVRTPCRKVYTIRWRWRRDLGESVRLRARLAIAGWLNVVGLRVFKFSTLGRHGQRLHVYGLRGPPRVVDRELRELGSGRAIMSFVVATVDGLRDGPVVGGLRTARGAKMPGPTPDFGLEALDAGLRRLGKRLT